MRTSTILFGFAASATALSGGSVPTVVPVQQIGDGQIQNPVSAPAAPPAPSSAYNAPPPAAPSSVYNAPPPAAHSSKPAPPPAAPSSAYNAPPAPSGGGIPPSYGNVTATLHKTKTNTATVVKPTAPGSVPASAPATVASSAPPASSSKPAVQTANSANTLVGSTIGLGFFAVLAAFLG